MKPIQFRGVRPRASQSGTAAIEFALVLPLLIVLSYAGTVYSYVYFLQQAINYAAQQGAEAGVAVVPTTSATAYQTAQQNNADLLGKTTLKWLPGTQYAMVTSAAPTVCPGDAALPAGVSAFVYQITFNNIATLFPSLVSLPLGQGQTMTFPQLPTNLTACAVAFD